MNSYPDSAKLARLAELQEQLLASVAALLAAQNSGSLELETSTPSQSRAPEARTLDAQPEAWQDEESAARYPVGYFGLHHQLTMAQAWEANRRLSKANRERPIRGRHRQQRMARRIAGILSAVKGGRVGNAGWGRSMLATKGGNTMRDHGPHILAANRRKILAQRQNQPETYTVWQQALGTWPQ